MKEMLDGMKYFNYIEQKIKARNNDFYIRTHFNKEKKHGNKNMVKHAVF